MSKKIAIQILEYLISAHNPWSNGMKDFANVSGRSQDMKDTCLMISTQHEDFAKFLKLAINELQPKEPKRSQEPNPNLFHEFCE